eukprot:CAMPEP_0114336022 /NCGR_PEP_ID=MMETSP0101-20121206/5437_1 /TAXON_ID=38822 ORGANISM="Pteridomonas danica, Strain PT" /NCGR_SAMPLE_ID=MMETSP0101 /ASSEMBLY_ACC=CAM_ASM_000211 /LENGTH=295 /DNA_ID=CAMNT_0001467821 /DNA_START=3215 /DNA_END=4102 /DNA_ORIENTATION=+
MEMKKYLDITSLKSLSSSTSSTSSHKNGKRKSQNDIGDDQCQELDVGFLAFACQTLCYLPYDVQEEPLFIIYHINHFVNYQGSTLLENFRAELKSTGIKVVDSDDEDGDDNGGDGMNEPSSKTSKKIQNNHSKSNKKNSQSSSSSRLRNYALESFSVTLLLYIKHFLKDLYNLSNTRCHDYAPTESTKATERPITRFEEMSLLTLPNPGVLGNPTHELTLEEINTFFDHFNKLMKQDPNDFKIAPTKQKSQKNNDINHEVKNNKRKKKTTAPKKKKKKAKVNSDSDDGEDSDYGQ